MAFYRRMRRQGALVFFSAHLAEPGSDLLVREIDLLRWAVGRTRAALPFEVLIWTVLPDRMDTIWRLPSGDSAYARRWGAIKGRFTRGLTEAGRSPALRPDARVERGEVGIWRKRFWEHHIRGPDDLAAHMRHCRRLPVEAGLVSRAVDWPYSSFSTAQRERRAAKASQVTVDGTS